jgi:hypothetical protein
MDKDTPGTPPSIGRIVHYVSRGSADGVYEPVHVPLLVVASWIEPSENHAVYVNGWTFNSHGQRYEESVPFDGDGERGTWHWPCQVP